MDLIVRLNKKRWNLLKCGCRTALYCVAITVGITLLMAQSGKIDTRDQKAAEQITMAKKALGGEKNIDNVKSLIIKGTEKYVQSNVEYEMELRILLPDNYIFISTNRSTGVIVFKGVSNGELRNTGFTKTGERIGVPSTTSLNELNRFACLLMGALMKDDPVAPLFLSSSANTSNKFSVAKETGVLGEIEFDTKEKYPLHISFKDVAAKTKTETTADPNTRMGSYTRSAEIEAVDAVMRFEDRFAVDGIMFPRTIVYEQRGNAYMEYKFENVQINPKLTLADFEIPKQQRTIDLEVAK